MTQLLAFSAYFDAVARFLVPPNLARPIGRKRRFQSPCRRVTDLLIAYALGVDLGRGWWEQRTLDFYGLAALGHRNEGAWPHVSEWSPGRGIFDVYTHALADDPEWTRVLSSGHGDFHHVGRRRVFVFAHAPNSITPGTPIAMVGGAYTDAQVGEWRARHVANDALALVRRKLEEATGYKRILTIEEGIDAVRVLPSKSVAYRAMMGVLEKAPWPKTSVDLDYARRTGLEIDRREATR